MHLANISERVDVCMIARFVDGVVMRARLLAAAALPLQITIDCIE